MNDRGCYCESGQTSCGTCRTCGAPGHTRAYPGPAPYTGAWCDTCYARLSESRSPAYWVRAAVILLALAPALVLLYRCAA